MSQPKYPLSEGHMAWPTYLESFRQHLQAKRCLPPVTTFPLEPPKVGLSFSFKGVKCPSTHLAWYAQVRPGLSPPQDCEPLGPGWSPLREAPEPHLGHPGVGRGSGSPQQAWQNVRALFALSSHWSQVVTSPCTAPQPSQATGNT